MHQPPKIEYESWPDRKGYRLRQTKPLGQRVVRNGESNEDLKLFRPFDRGEGLFRVFARSATTPEGVLEFVTKFGPLTYEGNDPSRGDLVALAIHHAKDMSQILDDIAAGRWPPAIPGEFEMAPESSVRAAVVWDPVAKAARWQFRPRTLLDALWLECGHALARGAHIRTCRHCGQWFEAGGGADLRADAQFCSAEHRIAFNSRKRTTKLSTRR